MNTPRSLHPQGVRRRGLYAGALLTSLAVATILVEAFLPRLNNRPLSSALLAAVLVALVAAIALHVRFLVLARSEHHETADALTTTEHEFQSIFDSALDGLLILDDSGICLEANPAALGLLGTTRQELVGHLVQDFQAPPYQAEDTGIELLGRTDGHGEMQVSSRDGRSVFVEYSTKMNYLPGRHVVVLHNISERKRAELDLRQSDERFQQMADNIKEIFWMLDAETKHVIYVNQAFEAITGWSRVTLCEDPTSYQELFHPEDHDRVLIRLAEAAHTGRFDEEFRIVRPDHLIRTVWVRGFPVRDSAGTVRRLVGTAQDITDRKSAENQMAQNLALAETAWAEADALRKTTLALTQNLSMDYVLDTLLGSLHDLIPCDSAQVLLLETASRLFLAREIPAHKADHPTRDFPITWDAEEHPPLTQALGSRNSVFIPDTNTQGGWSEFKGHSQFRSWLCVPLVASQTTLGLLSLGDTSVHAFTQEHLRLAKSLAIPAAVAIQNARLYERAEIYGAELRQRVTDLEQVRRALEQAEYSQAISEAKFTTIFRSSPIAFTITTVEEGRFIDVNQAFEQRYGYQRSDLIGRTVFETNLWADPDGRSQMLNEIRKHGCIRNRVTCLRNCAGELVETIYSAQIIQLESQQCILAVTEDLPDHAIV